MCIITVKRRKKMLTIPRVAQLRICGRLTSWLWNRLCLFISDKQKQRKKEGSLCGWWLGHWFYWKCSFDGIHTNKLYQFPIQEYLIFCDENSLTWPETTQRAAEGEDSIFQYSFWSVKRLPVLNSVFCLWSLGCYRVSGFVPCSHQVLFCELLELMAESFSS